MTGTENRSHLDRRSLLTRAAGVGAATALPAVAVQAVPASASPARRPPANWPDPEPYGLADVRPDLWRQAYGTAAAGRVQ